MKKSSGKTTSTDGGARPRSGLGRPPRLPPGLGVAGNKDRPAFLKRFREVAKKVARCSRCGKGPVFDRIRSLRADPKRKYVFYVITWLCRECSVLIHSHIHEVKTAEMAGRRVELQSQLSAKRRELRASLKARRPGGDGTSPSTFADGKPK